MVESIFTIFSALLAPIGYMAYDRVDFSLLLSLLLNCATNYNVLLLNRGTKYPFGG